ncbi:MAG: magnesium transporter [Deltaproteobacteria bacterium]|nr:magnesium transporter [Deltaproteobacteria bacterium]
MITKKVQVLSETVKKLLHIHADENLKNILNKTHHADIAYVLSGMNVSEQTEVFSLLQSEQMGTVLSELPLEKAEALLEALGAERSADILNHVSPDDAADILEHLPEELSSAILLRLKKEEAEEVEELIRHRPDTAGGIMSPEVFSLPEEITVAEAIAQLQKSRPVESVFYVYVVNPQGQLVGVLSLKKLILAGPQAALQDIMDKDPHRVRVDEDQEEVARTVSRYNYLSLPVVDASNKLVGVVTVDDVIDVIKEEATEDLLLMTGAGKEAAGKVTLFENLKKRMPWFFVTLIGGLIASEVIVRYTPFITKIGLLAGFIPLVLAMGGNIGTQSMTIVVSSLLGGRLSMREVWGAMFREFRLAIILGLSYGLLLAVFIGLRYGAGPFLPVAIGTALALSMIIAVAVGTLIPVLFQKVGIDPAVATGPFVGTLVNIFCMWAYFALAIYFIGRPLVGLSS